MCHVQETTFFLDALIDLSIKKFNTTQVQTSCGEIEGDYHGIFTAETD